MFILLLSNVFVQSSEHQELSALNIVMERGDIFWGVASKLDRHDWDHQKFGELYNLLWYVEKTVDEKRIAGWEANLQNGVFQKKSLSIKKRKRDVSLENEPCVDVYSIEIKSEQGGKFFTKKTWTGHRHYISADATPEQFADMPGLQKLIVFLQDNLVHSVAIFYQNPNQMYEDGEIVPIPGFKFNRNSDGSIQSLYVKNLSEIIKQENNELEAMAALVAHEGRRNTVLGLTLASLLREKS